MKKLILLLAFSYVSNSIAVAQSSIYQFDDWNGSSFTSVDNAYAGAGVYTFSQPTASQGQIVCNVGAGAYGVFNIYWPTGAINVTPLLPTVTVTMRVKATEDVSIRLDLQDNVNYRATNLNPQTADVIAANGFQLITFQFTSAEFFNSSNDPVDKTSINTYGIYINPGGANPYTGTVTIDYIYIGTTPPTSLAKSNILPGGLNVYPNPCSTSSEVEFSLLESAEVSWQLSDAVGVVRKSFYQGGLSQGKHAINVSLDEFPEGLYYLTLQLDESSIATYKIVKNTRF